MSIKFQDEDLRSWEAYASAGRFGLSERARIVFHCLTDPSLRAKVLEQDGGRAVAEGVVRDATPVELREFLSRAVDLN